MQGELINKIIQNLTNITFRNPQYKKLYEDILKIKTNFTQRREYVFSYASYITDEGVINLKAVLSKKTNNAADLNRFMVLSRLTQALFIYSGLENEDIDKLITITSNIVSKLQINGDVNSVTKHLRNNYWLITLILIDIHTDMYVQQNQRKTP